MDRRRQVVLARRFINKGQTHSVSTKCAANETESPSGGIINPTSAVPAPKASANTASELKLRESQLPGLPSAPKGAVGCIACGTAKAVPFPFLAPT